MAIDDAERQAWVALAAVDGVAEGILARFIAHFGSAAETIAVAAARDAPQALRRLVDVAPRRLSLVVAGRVRVAALDPAALERRLAAIGAWVTTPLDADHPDRLRRLEPPPLAIFGTGDRTLLGRTRFVAVVGTRHATPGGRTLAARIARKLVEAGAVVVSGLAVGIDGAAHAATVDAGGQTIAVIGGGLDHPGPRAHDRLRRAILATGGALIGEHAPHIHPTRGTFPRRNRTISALATGTIVVEAPERSGALIITARHALEQGRVVLAWPGEGEAATTAGCRALLRDTPARPLRDLDEMLEDLGLTPPLHPTRTLATGGPPDGHDLEDALGRLGPVERAVALRLVRGPASNDALALATGLPPSVVAGALTLLQVRGWSHPMGVVHLPAGPLLAARRASVSNGAVEGGVVR